MIKIQANELKQTMLEKLLQYGVPGEAAERCAQNLTDNSLDGVITHGANRFPRIIEYIQKGYIAPERTPIRVSAFGGFEQWDGQLGMGNTNAMLCMERATALAAGHGIGCVALRNTNHWMRGGAFGIQAARAGCVGICWTNTMPNMPVWGGVKASIGNNPLIMSVPCGGGYVMVDGAMAQFSYGALEKARMAGLQLPVPGGYDRAGNPTTDPGEVLTTLRVLPIGYWKGSGFSLLLDMIGTALSEGNSVPAIGRQCEDEYSLTQVFIAVRPPNEQTTERLVGEIIDAIHACEPLRPDAPILYPCERELRLRAENLREGIALEDAVWEQIKTL